MKIRILLAAASLCGFLFQGCNTTDPSTSGSAAVDGSWLLVKSVYSSDEGGNVEIDSMVYDTANVYGRQFVLIANEAIFSAGYSLVYEDFGYSNMAWFERFRSLGGDRYLMGQNDTVVAKRKGNALQLITTGEDEYERWEDTTYLVAYNGKFPPDEWYGPAEDVMEPDNTRLTAKPISVDAATQWRYLTENDLDWFSFRAEQGETYDISTAGNLYLQIDLYSSVGSKLATDTDYMYWECPASGTYYFRIQSYYDDEVGAYGASVSTYDYYDYAAKLANNKAARRGLMGKIPVRLYPAKP
jgi:hypothetical protein